VSGVLLVATTNPGKLRELQASVEGLVLRSLRDFPGLAEVEEDADTFEGNARKKALVYAKATGLPALADDSGLCVDALGGRPGVYSARYAPGDDAARVAKLLGELGQVPDEARTAAFVCALAFAFPDGRVVTEEGRCEGRIARAPRGSGGFGFDPVFEDPVSGKTFAELTHEEKHARSHRGRALAKMRPRLLLLRERES
jgi:XTP/dITP diphosphohydrolase